MREPSSIELITWVEREVRDLYEDPWRDELIALFAGKISNNKGTVGVRNTSMDSGGEDGVGL